MVVLKDRFCFFLLQRMIQIHPMLHDLITVALFMNFRMFNKERPDMLARCKPCAQLGTD